MDTIKQENVDDPEERPRAVKPEGGHVCELCNRVFSHPRYMVTHYRMAHTGASQRVCFVGSHISYPCEVCGELFSDRDLLFRHSALHTVTAAVKQEKPVVNTSEIDVETEVRFLCEICDKTFGTLDLLKSHLKSHVRSQVKNVVKAYKCAKCEKKFGAKDALLKHRKLHRKGMMFVCDLCEKGYKTKWNFEKHSKSHTQKLDDK